MLSQSENSKDFFLVLKLCLLIFLCILWFVFFSIFVVFLKKKTTTFITQDTKTYFSNLEK